MVDVDLLRVRIANTNDLAGRVSPSVESSVARVDVPDRGEVKRSEDSEGEFGRSEEESDREEGE